MNMFKSRSPSAGSDTFPWMSPQQGVEIRISCYPHGNVMYRRRGLVVLALLVATGRTLLSTEGETTYVSYADARPVLAALADHLPPALDGKTAAGLASIWPDWVKHRDVEIRARLARGDEDSVVNFWLYGTTFTKVPRATDVLKWRLDDFIAGLAAPSGNERLRRARAILERAGLDPTTAAGRAQVRRHLIDARQRAIAEFQRYDRTVQSNLRDDAGRGGATAYSTIFSSRGLSSDTSLSPDFGVEQALEAIKLQRKLMPNAVRDVAIVGPGLDFTNKADGYDFYPEQTTQPFAVVDSLVRLGLARSSEIEVTTFDLSPRVNGHLEAASRRARAGAPYVVQLPLNRDEQWSQELLSYWRRFGDGVGDEVSPAAAPPGAGHVQVRAVQVRASIAARIHPIDLNLVLQRIDRPFDLIVATNMLVYYNVFEQALAIANAGSMLRPGGIFLSNDAVLPVPPIQPTAGYLQVVYSPTERDHFFWYQRQ